MKEIIFSIEEDLENGGFFAEAKISVNEQIVTQAETIADLKLMIKDAIQCHFIIESEMPHKVIMNFTRQEVFAF
jgi:predicted RNase H-like HicB family nuclease